MITLNVTHVHILTDGSGVDQIQMTTTLPDGCFPYTGCATVVMHVAKGGAVEWLKTNFPSIIPEITRMR